MFIFPWVFLTVFVGSDALEFYVRIAAGSPRAARSVNHVREIVCHFYNLTGEVYESASLQISDSESFNELRGVWKLRRHLKEFEDQSGRLFTHLKVPPTNFRENPPKNRTCIGFYSRVLVGNEIVARSCLTVQPRWMGNLIKKHPEFGKFRVNQLALPGTHNAGAFKVFDASDDLNEFYRDCQEESIYSQLIYGSRYLDLRAGIEYLSSSRSNQPNLWIYHWLLRTDTRVADVLKDVKRFLDENPSEIVIVDFHKLSLYFDRFDQLTELVESILGDYAFHGNFAKVTLGDLISTNKRALVSFADKELAKKYLPSVRHVWANTDSISELHRHLERQQIDETFSSARIPFSAMAQLTPQGWGIAWDTYDGGVRSLAHRTNFKIASWYMHDDLFRDYANIVSVDYLTSSDMVDILISINLKRIAQLSSDKEIEKAIMAAMAA